MAKTASLKKTSRLGDRCTDGESCPALPPGARAAVSNRTRRMTDGMLALRSGDDMADNIPRDARSGAG